MVIMKILDIVMFVTILVQHVLNQLTTNVKLVNLATYFIMENVLVHAQKEPIWKMVFVMNVMKVVKHVMEHLMLIVNHVRHHTSIMIMNV
jgi:hypothetical protein